MDEIFIVEVLQNALGHDGIFTHSTMNSKVTSLPAIKWKFDVISYDKGEYDRNYWISTNSIMIEMKFYFN